MTELTKNENILVILATYFPDLFFDVEDIIEIFGAYRGFYPICEANFMDRLGISQSEASDLYAALMGDVDFYAYAKAEGGLN